MKRLLVCITLICTGCGHGIESGTGKKIGQVIQLGQHGLICQTYEGRLVRGGFNTGSGVVGGVFEFTVEGAELYEGLMRAMEKQQELEVTYEKVSFSGPCTCESDHFIRSFRVVNETTPSIVIKPQPIDPKEAKRQELRKQLEELDKQ